MSATMRVILAMACASLVLASPHSGLRGAMGNNTRAETPDEVFAALSRGARGNDTRAETPGEVSAAPSAEAGLSAQATIPEGPWCQWAPWLCGSPAPAPAPASCASLGCGGGYRPELPCQCNAECASHGNCCGDYWGSCGAAPAPSPPAPAPAPLPSCAALGCGGGYRPELPCQCNAECASHGNCCGDYWRSCGAAPAPSPPPAPAPPADDGNIKTLYHQTSPEIAGLILKSNFKPGTSGWCGGGIYFATTPEATNTKAIGPDSHKGFIIEAQVDVGRVLHLPKTCDGSMTEEKLQGMHYDSVTFDPGDGDEYVVYSSGKVLSMKQYAR